MCVFVMGSKDNAVSDRKKCRGRCRNDKLLEWDIAEVACLAGLAECYRSDGRKRIHFLYVSKEL